MKTPEQQAQEWAEERYRWLSEFLAKEGIPLNEVRGLAGIGDLRLGFQAGHAAGKQDERWISVKLAVPEMDRTVLVAVKEREFQQDHLLTATWTRDSAAGQQKEPYWCTASGYEALNVTHWMPLPKPPKADTGGEKV